MLGTNSMAAGIFRASICASCPAALGMAMAIEKMGTGLRRLSEEDPTLTLRRDPQTGEQLLFGLTQMQVEVAVDDKGRATTEPFATSADDDE